jgi:aromatic-L-amino-acid decarboxylase
MPAERTPKHGDDPLALDAETMRALGHRTVDALVDLLVDTDAPALRRATPQEMARRLPAGAAGAEVPQSFDALLDRLREDVFPFRSRLDHPGYFAFIPACGTFPGALGDFLASALNPYVGTWMEAAGPSRLELVVLGWFKEWIGYPELAAGVLVSGGSSANMTALACARETLLGPMTAGAVAYVSDQGHSSFARAARLLGFRPDQLRVLPADRDGRLRPETLAAAIDADAGAGRTPLFAAGVAGTTNTGAIDPLAALARVCRDRGVWFHVDGAYGGFAAITERGRAALAGIELADSVTLDPHKWLYQPFECGSLMVRDGRHLRHAFEIVPDYLRDSAVGDAEVNFADHGLQLSRGSRALKIWLSVCYFGVPAFRAAIDRTLDLALLAERHVRATPQLELMSPASLGIVTFRRSGPAGEDERDAAGRNAALIAAFEATGRGLVSSTRLRGRYAIRMCVMNHTTAEQHVRDTLEWFARAPVAGNAPHAAPGHEPHAAPGTAPHAAPGAAPGTAPHAAPPIRAPGARRADPRDHVEPAQRLAIAPTELAALPLFTSLEPADLERVAGWARDLRVPPGEHVTRRWDARRDFYVILEGRAAVDRDGERLSELARGDFFGEIAALDWGAGFGYARLATVIATEALRLLVLAPAHLARLMAESPEIDEQIRRAVRERLPAAAD